MSNNVVSIQPRVGLYAGGFVTGWANQILPPVMTAQALLLAGSLSPVRLRSRGMMTDGMQLVQLLRTGPADDP